MHLLINDLSLYGQFQDLGTFRDAISVLMSIRQVAEQYGSRVSCHKGLAVAQVTANMIMPQAVQGLRPNERSAFMQWITRQGPFWEEARMHGVRDWLEWNGSPVSDTAVGEAAWCYLQGIDSGLVSFTPSNWTFTPVLVDLVHDEHSRTRAEVPNRWDRAGVEGLLKLKPSPIRTWAELRDRVQARFTKLTFAGDAFEALLPHPFVSSAAERLTVIFDTLDKLKSCYDEEGNRTAEGHEIYQKFFTGKKGDGGRGALFSDSSDSEKSAFTKEMTFKHPEVKDRCFFCPWHGKVQTPQLRVHFSYPICAKQKLFIVYVGPKITKG